jgi:hypothetical protein
LEKAHVAQGWQGEEESSEYKGTAQEGHDGNEGSEMENDNE